MWPGARAGLTGPHRKRVFARSNRAPATFCRVGDGRRPPKDCRRLSPRASDSPSIQVLYVQASRSPPADSGKVKQRSS